MVKFGKNISLLISLYLLGIPLLPAGADQIIDIVVASVNNQPITLEDISNRLTPIRHLTLREAASDPEARLVLERMVNEKLLAAEAKERHLSVDDGEVETYINEVAQRNNMSKLEFEAALKNEGLTLPEYRRQISNEILRSKISSAIVRDGVGITREEIDNYLKQNPTLAQAGSKIQLRQILVAFSKDGETRSEQDALDIISKIQKRIAKGEEFTTLAREFSDGAEGSDGGDLGLINTADLSQQFLDAVLLLDAGQTSSVVQTVDGLRIFQVVEKYSAPSKDSDEDESTKKLEVEVRKVLERQKLEEKLATFFTVDLMKKHQVDRKI